ncbi:MAG: hypothetical protein M1378_07940 [Bacteroidetes bacterium]|nr:hypothetical protein [Bacteroidota bacterium]
MEKEPRVRMCWSGGAVHTGNAVEMQARRHHGKVSGSSVLCDLCLRSHKGDVPTATANSSFCGLPAEGRAATAVAVGIPVRQFGTLNRMCQQPVSEIDRVGNTGFASLRGKIMGWYAKVHIGGAFSKELPVEQRQDLENKSLTR